MDWITAFFPCIGCLVFYALAGAATVNFLISHILSRPRLRSLGIKYCGSGMEYCRNPRNCSCNDNAIALLPGLQLFLMIVGLVSAMIIASSHLGSPSTALFAGSPGWIGFAMMAVGMGAYGLGWATFGAYMGLFMLGRWSARNLLALARAWKEKRNVRSKIKERKHDHLRKRFDEAVKRGAKHLAVGDDISFANEVAKIRNIFEKALELLGVLDPIFEQAPSDPVAVAMVSADRLFPSVDVRTALGSYPQLLQADWEKLKCIRLDAQVVVEAGIFAAETLVISTTYAQVMGEAKSTLELNAAFNHLTVVMANSGPSGSLNALTSGAVAGNLASLLTAADEMSSASESRLSVEDAVQKCVPRPKASA